MQPLTRIVLALESMADDLGRTADWLVTQPREETIPEVAPEAEPTFVAPPSKKRLTWEIFFSVPDPDSEWYWPEVGG